MASLQLQQRERGKKKIFKRCAQHPHQLLFDASVAERAEAKLQDLKTLVLHQSHLKRSQRIQVAGRSQLSMAELLNKSVFKVIPQKTDCILNIYSHDQPPLFPKPMSFLISSVLLHCRNRLNIPATTSSPTLVKDLGLWKQVVENQDNSYELEGSYHHLLPSGYHTPGATQNRPRSDRRQGLLQPQMLASQMGPAN